MKKAFITGIFGQDGAYLSRLLVDKGYEVIGGDLKTDRQMYRNLDVLGVGNKVKVLIFDLTNEDLIEKVLLSEKPDEIYNLAGQSSVKASFDNPDQTMNVNAKGVERLLSAVGSGLPGCRFFQASSSEIFAGSNGKTLNENSIPSPVSPYGQSKLQAHNAVKKYRGLGVFACSGLLFNHESILRSPDFVSKKIVTAAVNIAKGKQCELILGNIDSKKDFGFAGDFVNAMWLMLQQRKPGDYVVSTGELHSVREFVEQAFAAVGIELEWAGSGILEAGMDKKSKVIRVRISEEFYRKTETNPLAGDYSKANRLLGWEPKVKFKELIGLMMNYELKNSGEGILIEP